MHKIASTGFIDPRTSLATLIQEQVQDTRTWVLPGYIGSWFGAKPIPIRGAIEDLPRKTQLVLESARVVKSGVVELWVQLTFQQLKDCPNESGEPVPWKRAWAQWDYVDGKTLYVCLTDFERDFLDEMALKLERLAYKV